MHSTKLLLHLLHPKDDNSVLMKYSNGAVTDPYKNIRQFISEKVLFPISYLTYNWNTILWNFPTALFSWSFKYWSWMYIVEFNWDPWKCSWYAKATFCYGLYCSCCNEFITNSDRFSSSIVTLLGWLFIAVDVHFSTYCKIKQKNSDPKEKSSA